MTAPRTTRRRRVVRPAALGVLLTVASLVGGLLVSGPALAATRATPTTQTTAAPTAASERSASRAEATYASLVSHFSVPDGTGLVREQFPVAAGDNPYSYEWPFSQVHVAALDLTGLPGARGTAHRAELATREMGQEQYWLASGGTTGVPAYASYVQPAATVADDVYYDDNEWAGLADVQNNLMTGDAVALRKAKQVFRLVVSGWDTDATHAAPGGVFWTQGTFTGDRNTVSNMPGALLGLRLYQATKDPLFLAWATRMYQWTTTWLQRPDGLYCDHLALDGTVEPTVWSYNQGVPIGVNVLFYEVTGERRYLTEAKRIASAASAYYGTTGLDAQPAPFNAIYFTQLLHLDAVTGSTTYRKQVVAYADRMWTTRRDPATGLFPSSPTAPTQVIDQAAMVRVYAMLGWSPDRWALLS